jgi:hypothetical protein
MTHPHALQDLRKAVAHGAASRGFACDDWRIPRWRPTSRTFGLNLHPDDLRFRRHDRAVGSDAVGPLEGHRLGKVQNGALPGDRREFPWALTYHWQVAGTDLLGTRGSVRIGDQKARYRLMRPAWEAASRSVPQITTTAGGRLRTRGGPGRRGRPPRCEKAPASDGTCGTDPNHDFLPGGLDTGVNLHNVGTRLSPVLPGGVNNEPGVPINLVQ